MKNFSIENETNNITVHASAKEAEAVPNSERFSNEAALAKLASDWPAARLVEIWNSLPGETPVRKFKDRVTAVSRIWKALQGLGQTAPAAGETGQPEALVSESTERAPAADVAPHAPNVAPAGRASKKNAAPPETPAETASIDMENCSQLLRIAAGTRRSALVLSPHKKPPPFSPTTSASP